MASQSPPAARGCVQSHGRAVRCAPEEASGGRDGTSPATGLANIVILHATSNNVRNSGGDIPQNRDFLKRIFFLNTWDFLDFQYFQNKVTEIRGGIRIWEWVVLTHLNPSRYSKRRGDAPCFYLLILHGLDLARDRIGLRTDLVSMSIGTIYAGSHRLVSVWRICFEMPIMPYHNKYVLTCLCVFDDFDIKFEVILDAYARRYRTAFSNSEHLSGSYANCGGR